MAKSKNQICNLVFWPVSKPRSSLKWAFWPFARPRQPGKGEPPKFRFSAKNQAPPPLQIGFLAFGGAWARVAKSKNQICNLFFWPVSKLHSSLRWAFWPFARPRQPGGEPPKFRFSAKNQAPPPSKIQKSKGEGGGARRGGGEGGGAPRPQPLQIRYLAFWGALGKLGNMQKNQKSNLKSLKVKPQSP